MQNSLVGCSANKELETMWKEMARAYFEVPYQLLPVVTKENHKHLHVCWSLG